MIPKVSILIAIYNVSEYIEKCAHSLFNQTFTDIEYIFVNDGSLDTSIEKLLNVIEQYPERKNQIKIFHHLINKGSAAAKNTAIDNSTGCYISFVDSDDYIDPEMIEVLYMKAKAENADIVVSDFFIESKKKSIIVCDYISEIKENNFINMIKHEQTSSSMCNKLVKSTLYKRDDCRVTETLNYCEDWHIMTRLFFYANKIVKINQAYYHYIQYNKNSITKTINHMHFENVVQFWELLDTFLKEHNEFEKYKQVIEISKIQSKVRLMIDTQSSKLRKEFANMFHDEETNCISDFKRGEKLMLLLVRYKYFGLAQLFHNFLVLKHKKNLQKIS